MEFLNTTCGRTRQRAALPKTLIIGAEELTEPQEIANKLNIHFATVGSNTVSSLQIDDEIKQELETAWSPQSPPFVFSRANTAEVLKALESTRANWGCGAGGIPSALIKRCAATLARPLTHIVNLSLGSGRFPSALKDTRIIPLFKNNGDRRHAKNYRPISLVDYLSKVFEKIVLARLDKHLHSISFFSACQFGFRRARSTELALAHLWQEIADTVEGNQLCLGVFLDVSAAFNCLRHSYFLQALDLLGCNEVVVRWFRSYLSGRRQSVMVGGIESEWQEVVIGTPQGSILGPFMFLVLINFILLKIAAGDFCRTVTYADDTSLLFRIRPQVAQDDICAALKRVEDVVKIFERFRLVINASKTNITLFRPPQRSVEIAPVRFCGERMPWTESVKCLGLTLHETLSWQVHLGTLSSKCYAVVAMLRRLRELGFPTSSLMFVYKTLLVPLLCYGLAVWGGTYRLTLRRAEVIQNDAVRAIFCKRRTESVTEIMRTHELPKLSVLYSLHVALLAFKMSKGTIPKDIAFSITPVMRRTARRPTEFVMPIAVKESSRHALAYRLPAVWGSLPREIRSLSSAKKFTGEAKKFFLRLNR